ncbi:uncharacterized protein M421DRAFT_66501 [Didymella exigua CBS 183.55]|uniref:Uncharacterized protein n=1 Tax=Didymella exigua CBS 183.55 TaxID=1150837 RepID=A0A6A5RGV9_9PLEO|nr:uncharacterized protein M421DRAFT_66501 [Didymella exigua CBS 183.55]KAF1926992.1 hypothetical protein M421DRAFT_66501 [Didymella exigua CBS 183.55]
MTNQVDSFKRARELKASALENISILQSTPSSSLNQLNFQDSEDALITVLRAEGRPWGDIVTHLNQRRFSNKEAPTWTEAAVYSRFVLHNSVSATPAKEVGFEPGDYSHLRNAGSGREGTSKAGKKRVKDFQNATELSANIRRPATIEGAEGRDAEKEDVLVNAVAKVNRNFWVFVADEVEREGGKYIEPKELEKVFHNI